MSLLREPFWREYVFVVALTIILGAGCAAGTARALDAALGEAAHSLLGEAGQYDLIVHVRQDYREVAGRELQRLLVDLDPEVRVVPGVIVAGNANFLVELPDNLLKQDALEDVAARLEDVPGFNGYTWLLEPSLSVSGLQPALRDLVAREAASRAGSAGGGARRIERHRAARAHRVPGTGGGCPEGARGTAPGSGSAPARRRGVRAGPGDN